MAISNGVSNSLEMPVPKPDIVLQSIYKELQGTGLFASGFEAQQIRQGGAINTSYCLIGNNQRYFMKIFDSSHLTQLDRRGLFDIQMALSQLGKASKPLYLSQNRDFQIDSWIDQPTLDKCQVSLEQKVKLLAYTLTDIHCLTLEAPYLDLPRQWHQYRSQLKSRLTHKEKLQFQEYAEYWHACCNLERVFCHNDLSLKHVTGGGAALIFDWEYCAVSSPYFDLAACIEVNQLDDHLSKVFAQAYAERSNKVLSEVIEKIDRMTPLVNLTCELWYRVASGASGNIRQAGY